MNEFLTAKLITQGAYDDITSTNIPAYDRASKAVRELQRGISDSSNPEKRLKETCDILKKLEDELLNKTVAKMMGEETKAKGTGRYCMIIKVIKIHCQHTCTYPQPDQFVIMVSHIWTLPNDSFQ